MTAEPGGFTVICAAKGQPIEVMHWRGGTVAREKVTPKRALEMAAELVEAALLSVNIPDSGDGT